MPRINRFRIVNFRYDNDKKYIANEIFNFNTKNALMNLENGGGKSVILQLALQVLKPNCELSARKFIDYFKVNSGTVHIMIEWLLDTIRPEYLLTGICASRDTEGLKFFTYTHAYNDENQCDIKSIQAVNKENVVTIYSEFYKYLKGAQGLRINIYTRDRMKEYREKLSQSNLFENEFEAIRVINQSEGGIEKFFETSKKSRNVIEKLIIPAIPTIGHETQNILAESFKKHMDNLKSIPVLRRNIEIYDLFIDRSNELMKKLDKYGDIAKESNFLNREILVLEKLLSMLVSQFDEEIKRYSDDSLAVEYALAQLEYKKESLSCFLDNKKRKEYKNNLTSIEQDIRKLEKSISKMDKDLKFCLGVNKYFGILDYNSKIQANKARLEAIDLDEKELEEKVQELLAHLKLLIENEINVIKAKTDAISKEKEIAVYKLTEALKELEVYTGKKEELSNDLAVTRHKLTKLDEQQRNYYNTFSHDMTLILDPAKSLKDFCDSQKIMFQSRENAVAQKVQLEKLRDEITLGLGNLNAQKASMTERLKNRQAEYEVFCQKQGALNKSLEAAGISGKLYDNGTDDILKGMIDKIASNITSLLGILHGMEKQKLLLDGCDYFIPEEYIKVVNRFLRENNINSIPGALWLKNQSEDKRQGLLLSNPLLPYGIVVESSHMEKVKTLSEKLSKLIDNYPLTIISDGEKGIILDGNYLQNGTQFMISIDKRDAFILRSDKSGIFVNDDEFKSFVGSLDKRIVKSKEELEILKNDQEAMISLRNKVTDFNKEYDSKHDKTMEEEIDCLKKGILNIEEQHGKAFMELDETKRRLNKTIQEIEGYSNNIAKLGENISAMNSLVKVIQEIKLIRADEQSLEADLQKNLSAITELSNSKKDNQNKLDSSIATLNGLVREEKEFTKRLNEINTILSKEISDNNLSYDINETEAMIKALNEKRNSSEGNAMMEAIKSFNNMISDLEKEIQRLGFTKADFKENRELIPENEIIDKEEMLEKERANLKELLQKYNHAEGEFKYINGRIHTLREAIVKKYQNEPYDFTDEIIIEPEYFETGIAEYSQKLKKLRAIMGDVQRRKFDADRNLSGVKEFIEYRKITIPDDMTNDMEKLNGFGENMGISEFKSFDNKEIAVIIKKYRHEYEVLWNKREEMGRDIEKSFDNLYKDSSWDENNTVKQVLSNIMKGNLFNIEYMQDLFKKLFESVEKLKAACVLQLDECMRNKNELVIRCLQRANTVYEEIRMVDNFSKIKINGENTKTIRIEMPKWDEEQGKAAMTIYLEACIEEIKKHMENGSYDPAKIDNIITGFMSPQALLDAVISLNSINIKVYKPEHSIELSGYIPWEVVIKWSGGEKLAGFFAMFISIISYLRYKKTGYMESSKVIWIDNPFGQANAGHILKYIFELANATNTQMICLTGLQETNIYAQFDVVYSLVHRMLSNMSIIQSKSVKSVQGIEAGRYSVNHSL